MHGIKRIKQSPKFFLTSYSSFVWKYGPITLCCNHSLLHFILQLMVLLIDKFTPTNQEIGMNISWVKNKSNLTATLEIKI